MLDQDGLTLSFYLETLGSVYRCYVVAGITFTRRSYGCTPHLQCCFLQAPLPTFLFSRQRHWYIKGCSAAVKSRDALGQFGLRGTGDKLAGLVFHLGSEGLEGPTP